MNGGKELETYAEKIYGGNKPLIAVWISIILAAIFIYLSKVANFYFIFFSTPIIVIGLVITTTWQALMLRSKKIKEVVG